MQSHPSPDPWFRIVVVPLLIGLSLSACTLRKTPGDLVLVSVESVDEYDQEELSRPSDIVGLQSYMSERDAQSLAQAHGLQETLPKRHWPLLKVSFASKTNFTAFAKENAYWTSAEAFFCGREDEGQLMNFPDVFWRGTKVGQFEPDTISRFGGSVEAPYTYYFYLSVLREQDLDSHRPQYGFDFRKEVKDVCFWLRGGGFTLVPSRAFSNTVKIPKEWIEKALRDSPPVEPSVVGR